MVAVIGSDLAKGLIARFGGKLFAIVPVLMAMYQLSNMIAERAELFSMKMLENLFFFQLILV
jgi:hypothetical protein